MTRAAERWSEALSKWAVPDEILARAPEPPWHCPLSVFTYRPEVALADPSPSQQVAGSPCRRGQCPRRGLRRRCVQRSPSPTPAR
ncbi:MAG TPA: hypothetical protein VGV93_12335 [Acidimicrobiales bacterium]|nr:hypothetical protein [Acidimicrobiales bacterium]